MRAGPGGVNFRSSTPYSAPYSRAGGYRNINGPSGPYRHNAYNHPHAGYYGYGSRWWAPWRGWGWWNRWWWGPYWYGYGYGPYGYGSGGYGYGYPYRRSYAGVVCCVFLIFILVLVGVFYSAGGYFGQSRTLGFNSDYTQSQDVQAGSMATFSFSTQNPAVPLTVALSSVPLSSIPTITVSGSFSDTFGLSVNNYIYESFFFNLGSTFNMTFTCSASVDFFIADATNFNNWDQYQPYSTYYENTSIQSVTAFVPPVFASGVPQSQDYYLVWYNSGGPSSISVSLVINYTRTGVYDFSGTLYHQEAVDTLSQTTQTLPSTGTWYYIIYFDPWYSNEASTELTSNIVWVQTSTSPTGTAAPISPWIYVVPIVIVAMFIVTCASVLSSRKKARQVAAQMPRPATAPAPGQAPLEQEAPAVTPSPPSAASSSTCIACGAPLDPGAAFCGVCGRKQAGRQFGKPPIVTPKAAEFCSLCGANIEPGNKFCRNCGTPIE